MINEAQAIQKAAGYALDEFTTITLKKGTKIYGLAPGQSTWYTNLEALEKSGYSYKKMYEGLQIAPHDVFGYRKQVTVYELTEDVTVATGKALANKSIKTAEGIKYLGEGGHTQYVVSDYSKMLKAVNTINLHE